MVCLRIVVSLGGCGECRQHQVTPWGGGSDTNAGFPGRDGWVATSLPWLAGPPEIALELVGELSGLGGGGVPTVQAWERTISFPRLSGRYGRLHFPLESGVEKQMKNQPRSIEVIGTAWRGAEPAHAGDTKPSDASAPDPALWIAPWPNGRVRIFKYQCGWNRTPKRQLQCHPRSHLPTCCGANGHFYTPRCSLTPWKESSH